MKSVLIRFASLLTLLTLISGCEAPLNLTGVEQEQTRVFHRYDQFQAAAHRGEQVVVVGGDGAILLSHDSGKQWQRTELESQPSLIDVAVCADGRFIALDVARKVWVSDKALSQWQSRDINTAESVLALTCDGENRHWVVAGFSTILSSDDDGASWLEESTGDDAQLTTIQFVDAHTGYIAGEFGTVLKTLDGGKNWDRVADLPGEFYPQAAHFIDAMRGWVVGLNGAILYTDDGGDSWQAQASGIQMPLYGITSFGDSVYAVGENGVILAYKNNQWRLREHDEVVLSYLRGAVAVNDSLIVAGGSGALFTLAVTN